MCVLLVPTSKVSIFIQLGDWVILKSSLVNEDLQNEARLLFMINDTYYLQQLSVVWYLIQPNHPGEEFLRMRNVVGRPTQVYCAIHLLNCVSMQAPH